LRRNGLLSTFAEDAQAALAVYRRFVHDEIVQSDPWGQLEHRGFLGSETFVERFCVPLPRERDLSEFSRVQRRPPTKPIAEC
jgi:hypothetical protein